MEVLSDNEVLTNKVSIEEKSIRYLSQIAKTSGRHR